MTSRQITAVALKCLAIYLLFTALLVIPIWIYVPWRSAGQGLSPLAHAGITVVAVIAGCMLMIGFAMLSWTLANSIARDVVTPPGDDIHVRITPRGLEEILFRMLGVYFCITYLKPAVNELLRRQTQAAGGYDTSQSSWNLLASLGTIIFGLVLIRKPGRFADWLDRLTNKKAPTTESRASSDSATSVKSESPHS